MRAANLLMAVLAALAAIATDVVADASRHIRISGRPAATVTSREVRLGDIAQVSSDRIQDDEAVIALRKIEVHESPEPGRRAEIPGVAVLERLKRAGVDLGSLIYSLPHTIEITRAARNVGAEELEDAISKSLAGLARDITLVRVSVPRNSMVAPGETVLSARPLELPRGTGQGVFEVTASGAEGEGTRFTVQAQLAEWEEVPVASRALSRGSVVSAEDVVMARLNIAELPRDVLPESERVLGLEVKREISEGAAFKPTDLAIPPLVESGSKVTMRYQSDRFEATASGIALESGAAGQQIRVKNELSKKVVIGTVIEPGLVGVE